MLLDSELRPLNQNIPIEIPAKNTPFAPKLEPVKPAASASSASGTVQTEPPPVEPRQAQTNEVTPAPASSRAQPSVTAASEPAAAKADPPAAGKYLIQVAAYSKEEQAQEWVKKLKAAGFQAYTEKVTTNAGARIRVRVGPYAQQSDADKALALIKAQGASEARLVN
jgi:DedD protein